MAAEGGGSNKSLIVLSNHVQVDGNFAVYGSTCLKLAETGAFYKGQNPTAPCLTRPSGWCELQFAALA